MEKWKDIIGFEGLYQISNKGRVKGLKRKVRTKHSFRTIEESLLKLTPDRYGYILVGLNKNFKVKRMRVHRLVGIHFINNPENKPYINHKDGIKINNNYSNLEWTTAKENITHSIDTGLTDGKNGAILTEKQVKAIKIMLANGKTHKFIANIFKVTRSTITDINIGKTWKKE